MSRRNRVKCFNRAREKGQKAVKTAWETGVDGGLILRRTVEPNPYNREPYRSAFCDGSSVMAATPLERGKVVPL